ncbi:MAG: hypothetical protein HY698_13580 [Deltaproteobacteria bacterium]|nr:hypothetical protein [Deltaproteobacteria bacterium]
MESLSEHLPQNLIDRFLAQATTPEESTAVEDHSGACDRCAGRLREARADRDAFLVRNPPATRVAKLMEAKRPLRQGWLAVAFTITALGAAVLFLVSSPAPDRPQGNGILSKGEPKDLFVVRENESQASHVAGPSVTLRPGDVIEPKAAATGKHVTLASLSARGHVQVIAEKGPGPAAPLPSLVVDASTEKERLFLLVSTRPIDRELLERSLHGALAAAGGDLGAAFRVVLEGHPDLRVSSLLVTKQVSEHRSPEK